MSESNVYSCGVGYIKLTIDKSMKYLLPTLQYDDAALEPVLSRETIQVHYGKHEQAYINKLNDMIAGTDYEELSLEDVIRTSSGALFNNASQAWNHIFYFNTFSSQPQRHPRGELADAIVRHWETFENFCEVFEQKGVGIFGSGWVWLCCDTAGHLAIRAESNAGNPLTEGLIPLLTFDVWEHAYYIDYRNRRDTYLHHLWRLVDWHVVEQRYEAR